LDSSNAKNANELAKQYNAISNWETTPISFTYKIQQALQDTTITFTGRISDIAANVDSFKNYGGHQINYPSLIEPYTYQLRMVSIKSAKYTDEILLTTSQLKRLEQSLEKTSKKRFQKVCFVFKVDEIVSKFPEVETDITIKGHLIDYYLYKIIQED